MTIEMTPAERRQHMIDFAVDAAAKWPTWTAEQREAWIVKLFADEKRHPNWCAAFVSEMLEIGGIGAPTSGPTRRGAQALTRWVRKHGREVTGEKLQPGDVVCWRRGTEAWQGHVALITAVEAGHIEIVEGNVSEGGKRGQLARRRIPVAQWQGRLQGLYMVARPTWGEEPKAD